MDSAGPFVGRLFDRVGPRSVYTLGLGLLGAGLSLATLGTALWHFQLCIGLAAGVTAACLDNVPNGTLLVPLARRRQRRDPSSYRLHHHIGCTSPLPVLLSLGGLPRIWQWLRFS
jgi:MFS family permease